MLKTTETFVILLAITLLVSVLSQFIIQEFVDFIFKPRLESAVNKLLYVSVIY